MSTTYSLRPEGYRELYNQSLIRSVMTALVLMVIVGIVLVITGPKEAAPIPTCGFFSC